MRSVSFPCLAALLSVGACVSSPAEPTIVSTSQPLVSAPFDLADVVPRPAGYDNVPVRIVGGQHGFLVTYATVHKGVDETRYVKCATRASAEGVQVDVPGNCVWFGSTSSPDDHPAFDGTKYRDFSIDDDGDIASDYWDSEGTPHSASNAGLSGVTAPLAVACAPDGVCLAHWPSAGHQVFARLDANGRALDLVPQALAAQPAAASATVSSSSGFRVFWTAPDGATTGLWTTRIGVDGSLAEAAHVLDHTPDGVAVQLPTTVAAAADGERSLVAWSVPVSNARSETRGMMLDAAGEVEPSSRHVYTSEAELGVGLNLASVGGTFLLAFNRHASDDAHSLTLLDSDGAPRGDAFAVTSPAGRVLDRLVVAADSEQYMVLGSALDTSFSAAGTVRTYGQRVAADGSLLGGSSDLSMDVAKKEDVRGAWDGSQYVVAWTELRAPYDERLRGTRVTASGTLVDAEPLELLAAPQRFVKLHDVASNGDTTLVLANIAGVGDATIVIGRDGSATAPRALGTWGVVQSGAQLASDGEGYLAAWIDSGSVVRGWRFDRAGAPLDAEPFEIASYVPDGNSPTPQLDVSSSGSHYLVTWLGQTRASGEPVAYGVMAATVSPGGEVSPRMLLSRETTYGYSANLSSACGAGECVVAYSLKGDTDRLVRLDATGALLGATGQLPEDYLQYSFSLTWDGKAFLVLRYLTLDWLWPGGRRSVSTPFEAAVRQVLASDGQGGSLAIHDDANRLLGHIIGNDAQPGALIPAVPELHDAGVADAGGKPDQDAGAQDGDAGMEDAGVANDAGVADDASVGADAGTHSDAGSDEPSGRDASVTAPDQDDPSHARAKSGGGCSVSSPRASSFAWLLLLPCLVLARRRRITLVRGRLNAVTSLALAPTLLALSMLMLPGCPKHDDAKPECGNGIVEAGEECDDPHYDLEGTCDASCKHTAVLMGDVSHAGVAVTSDDRVFVLSRDLPIVGLDAQGKRVVTLPQRYPTVVPDSWAGDSAGGLAIATSLGDGGFGGMVLEYFPRTGAAQMGLLQGAHDGWLFAMPSGLYGLVEVTRIATTSSSKKDSLKVSVTAFRDGTKPVLAVTTNLMFASLWPGEDNIEIGNIAVDVAEVAGKVQLIVRSSQTQWNDKARAAFLAFDDTGALQTASACGIPWAHLLEDGTLVGLVYGALAVDRDGTDGCLSLDSQHGVLLPEGLDLEARTGHELLLGVLAVKIDAKGAPRVEGRWQLPDHIVNIRTFSPLAGEKLIVLTEAGHVLLIDRTNLQPLTLPLPANDGTSCNIDLQCAGGLCLTKDCVAPLPGDFGMCASLGSCTPAQTP